LTFHYWIYKVTSVTLKVNPGVKKVITLPYILMKKKKGKKRTFDAIIAEGVKEAALRSRPDIFSEI